MDRLLPAQWAMVAAIWAAAGAWAGGEEAKATMAAGAGPPDPIAEAKRQFEAIRNQRRELVSDAELKLNIAPPPALSIDQPSPQQARAASPFDAAKADNRKTWLLDAMRQSGKTDEKGRRRGDDEAMGAQDPGRNKGPAGDTEAAPRDSRMKQQTAPGVDPLRGYLAVWMTPGDYSLLVKPTKDRAETALANDLTAGLAPLSTLGGRAADESWAGPGGSSTPTDSTPHANPYLQTSQFGTAALGAVGGSASIPAGAQAESKPPIPASAKTPEYTDPAQPAALPALPDRLKPADDKKYFPQLKRF
jgi:hypothetical protein